MIRFHFLFALAVIPLAIRTCAGAQSATTTAVDATVAITYQSTTQAISLGATVTSQAGVLNEGTVTFQLKSGDSNIGVAVTSGSLTNGVTGAVSYSVPAGTPAGAYVIIAVYNGTPSFAISVDASQQLTINKAPLTVVADNASRQYGTNNPVFTGTVTGAQPGDGITATYSSSTSAYYVVGNYQIVPTVVDLNHKLGNYAVTVANGTLSITKAPLTAVAFVGSRPYGAANPTLGTLTGVVNGDMVVAQFTTSATQSSPPGDYPIVTTVLDLNNDPDVEPYTDNYTVTKSDGMLTILPIGTATTTTVAAVAPITYQTAVQTVTLSATVTSQSGPLNQGTVTFQLKNGDSNVGNSVTSGTLVNGATGDVSYSVPGGTSAGAYVVLATYNGALGQTSVDASQQLTINKALLTVAADNASRQYGTSNPVFTGTVTGAQPGDGITATYSSSTNAYHVVGNYQIVPTVADPNQKLSNYAVNLLNGTLSINKAPLSAVAFVGSRSYGSANPTLGTLTGVVNGDPIVAQFTTSATQSSPPGDYPIVTTVIDTNNDPDLGPFLDNYTLAKSDGMLTILPTGTATTTMAAAVAPITYQTVVQTVTFSATVTSQSGPLNQGTVTFQLKNGNANVGNSVTSGTLVNGATGNVSYSVPAGTSAGAYVFLATYNGALGQTSVDASQQLTINKALLTVAADNASRQYGTSNPVFTGTVTGAQPGDGITATYSSSTSAYYVVGNYQIVPTVVDPNHKLGNYAVTVANGTLSITKAPLTAVAFVGSRPYGAANPTLGTLTGVVNGDMVVAQFTTTATQSSPPGDYPIVTTVLDLNNDPDVEPYTDNYTVTKSDGMLTILPIGTATTTTAAAVSPITYKSTAQNITLSATVLSQAGGVNSGAVTFQIKSGNANIGDAVTSRTLTNGATGAVTYSVPAGTPAGSYSVAATYNGVSPEQNSADTTQQLIIGKAVLTVAANNATRQYGSDNPAFTGTITGVEPGDSIVAAFATGADAQSDVGSYSIIPQLADPNGKLGNYSVTSANGVLSVTQADLVVAPANATKLHGAPNPPLVGVISGIKNNDDISAVYSTPATTESDVGQYPITATLVDPANKLGNYEVTVETGVLTIEPSVPVIVSGPSASTNMLTAGVPVTFNAVATDADGNPLSYFWVWGDGTFGSGASVTKTFAAAGTYLVTLVVSNGAASVSSSISVTVSGANGAATVDKFKVAFNFVKSSGDSINISGRIALPAAFVPVGKAVRVIVGDLDYNAVLLANRATADKAFALRGRTGAMARFVFSLNRETLFTKFETLGLSQNSNATGLNIPVVIVLDNNSYLGHATIDYRIKFKEGIPQSASGKQ